MADYEARRDGGGDAQSQHDHENAKNTARTAAKAAGTYFAGPVGGKAVDIASKTKLGNKVLDTAAKVINSNKALKNVNNKLNDSGAMKAAETAIDTVGAKGGGGKGIPNIKGGPNSTQVADASKAQAQQAQSRVQQAQDRIKQASTSGGGQDSSLPSSGDKKNKNDQSDSALGDNKKKKELGDSLGNNDDNKEEQSPQDKALNKFLIKMPLRMAISAAVPFLILILFLGAAAAYVSDIFGGSEDAINMSETMGEETGNVAAHATPEQQDFYDRVAEVKSRYQSNGKTIDAIAIVGTYYVIKENGGSITYNKMTTSAIEDIADAMFDTDSNTYNEETFKNNLKDTIIPKYISGLSEIKRKNLANDIINYSKKYSSLIDKYKKNNTCSGSGECSYDIKGFYINGKGNVTKNMQVSNLYVRLMQCGTASGHNYGGTFGQPLENEELVPFEKYVLGCAYAEVGTSFEEAAIKAQLVASRSYALARPFDMGGWRTLKEEDGKWILQAAACTQDQVYCDPDQGCSSTSGQWGQVHSGLSYTGGYKKEALAQDAPMRTYATEVEGEVLVNSSNYIIYTGFVSTDQNQWNSYAKTGLNYKQILLKHYNQGSRNYGASDIVKASCGGSGTNCSTTTGNYATWKQTDGSWGSVPLGNSSETISSAGCLATSLAIQIARSGVSTNVTGEFDPGSFVEYLNNYGAFGSYGDFLDYTNVTKVASSFTYQGIEYTSGWSKQAKLDKIKELTSQSGVYVVAEVKGNTGQHWVAIDSVNGNTITMFDPGSNATDLWGEYDWNNTSKLVYFKAG